MTNSNFGNNNLNRLPRTHSLDVYFDCVWDDNRAVFDCASVVLFRRAQGGELQRVVEAEDGLEESHAVRVMKHILEALVFLHSNNIAHLDLKVCLKYLLRRLVAFSYVGKMVQYLPRYT